MGGGSVNFVDPVTNLDHVIGINFFMYMNDSLLVRSWWVCVNRRGKWENESERNSFFHISNLRYLEGEVEICSGGRAFLKTSGGRKFFFQPKRHGEIITASMYIGSN